ncbi:lipoate--protein ligase [Brotonthovivens ammoniilytica]|uniref:lipoate--protein ligase n=1 Tax=Brotonthovivens ammoniilytica TaxID=2981725 RepID=A0ABT2TJP9_9FIRM|nr:lipoate--protein ligase [Brotonthovivens ammoniilytica]MCU6762430.1 lipoate--protein ligase [Brotonthovivens ammoniilytica]
MIFIQSNSTNPYYNLALEEYMFEQMDRNREYFMLWQNANTIVVGKYQNTLEEINQSFVDKYGLRVVRRLSGGGAVYHDLGNLNFTFVAGSREHPEFDFEKFALPVVETLKKFGICAQMNGRNDISIDGKKICGNSQYAKKGRVLHHGCIMLDSNLQNVSDALNVKVAKFESKSVKSVRARVTTINTYAKTPISMEAFKQALIQEVFCSCGLEVYHFSPEQEKEIERLQKEKYETWDWNYGRNPLCNMKRELKFSGGLLTAQMQIEHGVIEQIKFFGDFFGNGEIWELEKKLTGLRTDEYLKDHVEKMNVGYYIHGITEEELCRLLK